MKPIRKQLPHETRSDRKQMEGMDRQNFEDRMFEEIAGTKRRKLPRES
jgi:hypothetical protein